MNTITDHVITINHGMSLDDMIAAGKYDWHNRNITDAKFLVEGTGIVRFEPKVFHFNRFISSEDAIRAIKAADRQNPWEPATIKALIAYGAESPEEQRLYPIVGLGSVAEVHSYRHVPCLSRSGAERGLGLYLWGEGWDGCERFLAVRKLSVAA